MRRCDSPTNNQVEEVFEMVAPEPEVRNTASGAAGHVVQVGVVHGDVHLHAAPPQPTQVIPRQLPAAPALFAGRAADLTELDRALSTSVPNRVDIAVPGQASADVLVAGATVMVSAIGGAGGIGKTWLALAWAHRHLDRFPDGQLFVDLHGFSPAEEPMTSGAAVRGFLEALGVDPNRMPTDLDAQSALYRSLVAGRRMLIVLDNAATVDQIVSLLPGSPTCTVLVTGRRKLASLIDRYGARHLRLGVLTQAESRALLAARLGTDRVAADPEAVDELVELCRSYPLALSVTARNAATRPGIPLAEIVAELRDLGLEMLDHDTDPAASLPAVLSWSLRHLTDEQRTLFGLLGIAPGPDTTLPAVVSLADLSLARAHKALSALEEASLVERRPHGRYAMHDLVRDYAATTAHGLAKPVLKAAMERVVDFYLHTAHAADRLLEPHRQPILLDEPAPGTRPHPMSDVATAMAWLDAEHLHVLAAQHTAGLHHRHHVVWQLAWTMTTFHYRRGHRHNAVVAWQAALDAATHLNDAVITILAYRGLGHACTRLGRHEEATRHLRRALALADHHDNPVQQARTHRDLARDWEWQGDDRQALRHARRALNLYRTLDHPVWEADAANQVGWYAARLGDYNTARDHCQAALTLHQHHHNPAGEAVSLANLGYVAHHTHRHERALDCYELALALLWQVEDGYNVATTYDRMGQTHAALGQHEHARKVWREALELYREQGRDTDAQRVQQQLHDLDSSDEVDPDDPCQRVAGDADGPLSRPASSARSNSPSRQAAP
ncbi:hypothetical protein GCM10027184_53330 [Saccharothrix stipae]